MPAFLICSICVSIFFFFFIASYFLFADQVSWLEERQIQGGGVNGRPDKAADCCYAWWVLSSLTLLRHHHDDRRPHLAETVGILEQSQCSGLESDSEGKNRCCAAHGDSHAKNDADADGIHKRSGKKVQDSRSADGNGEKDTPSIESIADTHQDKSFTVIASSAPPMGIDTHLLMRFLLSLQVEGGGFSPRPRERADIFHTHFAVAALSLCGMTGVGVVNPSLCMPEDILSMCDDGVGRYF